MRRPPVAVRVLTHLPFMTVLACSTGLPQGPLSNFCPQDTTPGAGNIDKPSSVVIAVKMHGDSSQSAYAVTANPDIRQARAADLTRGLMVAAPAVYFPMAVKLGGFTEDLGISEDGEVAVALDQVDRSLRFFDVGDAKEGNAWRRHGDDVTGLGARPTGVAVRGRGTLTIAISHAGDDGGRLTVLRWNDGSVSSRACYAIGGRPSGVGLTEDAALAVVSDAASNSLIVIDLAADPASIAASCEPDAGVAAPFPACASGTRPCRLDVGGPTTDLAVGSAPGRPGDGAPRYPVVLALRRDTPAVAVARLRYDPPAELVGPSWVERMRSATDHLAATVILPRYPVAVALAPNPTPQCCVGVPFDVDPAARANGGFAYALVALVDGSIGYLDLDAEDARGRRTPRIIDKNSTPPGPLQDNNCNVVDYNTSPDNYVWPTRYQPDGGIIDAGPPDPLTRPRVEWSVTSDVVGDPPVVNQALDDDYVLVWEGVLAGVVGRRAQSTTTQLAQHLVEDTAAGVRLDRLGVEPGDAFEILPQAGCACPGSQPACDVVASLEIVEVAANQLRLDDTFSLWECLARPNGVAYRVRAARHFTVTGGMSGHDLGRVAFLQTREVPGLRFTLFPAGYQGELPSPTTARGDPFHASAPVAVLPDHPPPRDSVLVLPVRSNFDPFILSTNDVNPTLGRFIPAGSIPTGIATAVIPVITGTSTTGGTNYATKAVGVMGAAGGGLLLQFDLAQHPPCPSPGAATCAAALQCSSSLNRSNLDAQFKFFE